jgi:hypothetical protein
LSPSWNSNTPKMLWIKKRTPTPFSFIIVIFELAFESFKEFGGASLYIWTKFFVCYIQISQNIVPLVVLLIPLKRA